MRIRLDYLLELILVLAVGMATARWTVLEFMPEVRRRQVSLTVGTSVEPFLAGVSLGGGPGMWWESRRRRSPREWGIGRWTWLLACLTVVIGVAGSQVMFVGKLHGLRACAGAVRPWVRNGLCGVFAYRAGLAFLALWLTSRIARAPIDPAPDAREWAGRALLIAIMGWTVVSRVMRMFFWQ